MSVNLSWAVGDQALEAEFDAVVTETHSRSAQVTTHPVEQGSDVADHVYIEPLRLTIEAVVTNAPLGTPSTMNRNSRGEVRSVNAARANALQFDQVMDRPRDVYEAIRNGFQAKSRFTVDTALDVYEPMVITSLSVPRDAGSGHATSDGVVIDRLTFTIEMQQIREAESRTGEVRRPKQGTQKKKKQKGDKQKKEATEQESVLHALVN